MHWIKARIDDELGNDRIAAHVSFFQDVELLGPDLAKDITEIEIGFDNLLDFAAADITQVTLIAESHTAAPWGVQIVRNVRIVARA